MKRFVVKVAKALVNRLEETGEQRTAPKTERRPGAMDVTVVVSGLPISLIVYGHQKVHEFIRQAFNEASQPSADIAGWILRTEEGGREVSNGARIEDSDIATGSTLFLDPDEGGGGNVPILDVARVGV